ncbi:MAG: histone deacetylase family protein [Candidatus Omnitrophica bacterium]|nr:histone deacetylase family protein [Candidatus Omnitrophota bacterium]
MFRIRRIYDDSISINKEAIAQIQEILKTQFYELPEKDIAKVPDQLKNPQKYGYRSILFVADDLKGKVKGFALLLYFSDLNFCFLDYLSAAKYKTGYGVGGVLYEKVREEALSLGVIGLFYECLPDSPKLCHNPDILKQNKARLRFYERYGARPIINSMYETPIEPGKDNPPYVVFDSLGRDVELRQETVRKIVKSVLEKKYAGVCTPDYNKMVLDSFIDNPARLRKAIYTKKTETIPVKTTIPFDKSIILVVSDQHAIHHIKERGYVESPVRIATILKELEKTEIFERVPIQSFGERYITVVHDKDFVDYFKKASDTLKPSQSIYPYVFPLRNTARPPRDLPDKAGYYCMDTFTPITRNAYIAAKRAVDCTLTATRYILLGHRLAYALVRPPGHHAERRAFGGFCYFNSAAIAAQHLSGHGKVAILDLDHHHGNGQERIFYERRDVLTISIHVHPRFNYPFFAGFREEKGKGKGKGYNINVPLPEQNVDGPRYRSILQRVIKRIVEFSPKFLIVPLGLDTSKRDPTGTWNLLSRDYEANGRLIGSLRFPTLVVQEGGYNNRVLGINARSFFKGLWETTFSGQEK